jgi:hypothetical protein
MITEHISITDELTDDIRARAESAGSPREIVGVILEAFADAQVDLRTVSLEEMKRVLVAAVRAARNSPAQSIAV